MPPRNPQSSANEIATFDKTYSQQMTDFLSSFQNELGNGGEKASIEVTISIGSNSRTFLFKGVHDQGHMDSIFGRFLDAHNNKGNEIANIMSAAGIENDPNS